jgi:uncharacterized protein involved in tolerance to divalent cations
VWTITRRASRPPDPSRSSSPSTSLITPAAQSIYRWNDGIERDEEAILLAKTTADRYEALRSRVVELHPHEVPCVERFDEADVLEGFATWRADAVEAPSPN